MAGLALQMDRDLDEPLSSEFVHIDATHTRCKGFKSITLWTYHPVLCKLLRIPILEVEEENTENLVKFWEILNEMLQKVSGRDNYKFNPTGFVADEHHCNWNSIKRVFGDDVLERVVSCEIHYKQSVRRRSKNLDGSSCELFLKISDLMLTVLTVNDFELQCSEMKTFIKDHPILQDWFNWWYLRRTHIFRCFKPTSAPATNLAEVGHAKLSTVGRQYMSLLRGIERRCCIGNQTRC